MLAIEGMCGSLLWQFVKRKCRVVRSPSSANTIVVIVVEDHLTPERLSSGEEDEEQWLKPAISGGLQGFWPLRSLPQKWCKFP